MQLPCVIIMSKRVGDWSIGFSLDLRLGWCCLYFNRLGPPSFSLTVICVWNVPGCVYLSVYILSYHFSHTHVEFVDCCWVPFVGCCLISMPGECNGLFWSEGVGELTSFEGCAYLLYDCFCFQTMKNKIKEWTEESSAGRVGLIMSIEHKDKKKKKSIFSCFLFVCSFLK